MDRSSVINDIKTLPIKEFAIKYDVPLLKRKKIIINDNIQYSWADQKWLEQYKSSWSYDEVSCLEDKKDWEKLDKDSQELLKKLFLFFTQIELEINGIYIKYLDIFAPFELHKMFRKFASMEDMHASAYKYLMLNIFGEKANEMMHDFLEYEIMLNKYETLQDYKLDTIENLTTTMIMYGAFSEGVLLYASFAIFLFFPFVKKTLKGTGDLLSWSTKDESLHVESMALLFKQMMVELPEETLGIIENNIYEKAKQMVSLEWNFIDWIFENISIDNINVSNKPGEQLNPEILKEYIAYKANYRLQQFGFKPIYPVEKNPLNWMDFFGGVENISFFEGQNTNYFLKEGNNNITNEDLDDLFN